MCRNSNEENNKGNRSIKNKAKKTVPKAMREKAEEALTEFKFCRMSMFRQVLGLKIDSKDVQKRKKLKEEAV